MWLAGGEFPDLVKAFYFIVSVHTFLLVFLLSWVPMSAFAFIFNFMVVPTC